MKFKAAVLIETKKPLEVIDEIVLPTLGQGQVLVKIAFSGVCHSQLMEVEGLRGKDKYLPHLLGHEATGVVVDIGKDVTKVKTGDRVVLGWLKGAGNDVLGAIYDSPIGKINSGAVTTFNQYSIVSENRCYHLPRNISMEEGVLLGCALPTGIGVVKNQINPTNQDVIGILGLGGIGMSALLGLLNLPHKMVVAIDTNQEKLELAARLGADLCINPIVADPLSVISSATNNKMLDYIVEAAGRSETIEQAFSLVNRNHGHCIFVSHPAAGSKIKLDPFELICGKKITGSWGGNADPEEICDFVSCNRHGMDFSPFIINRYKLEEVNEGLEDLKQKKVLRAILSIAPELESE